MNLNEKKIKKVKTKDYFVAYLDILGTKDLVKQDKDGIYLNKINLMIKRSYNFVYKVTKFDKKNTFIKVFSDNILLAEEVEDNYVKINRYNLDRICCFCNIFQYNALKNGYYIRGALTKGKFYKNKLFVYGEALIDAVTMEEKNAFYPRIIAIKEIVNLFPQYFIKDMDGIYYLNTFFYAHNKEDINNIRNILLENLKKFKNDKKITQKNMWMITNYNNYFNGLKENNESYADFKCIIDEEIFDALK